jgi:hypothetical protein
MPFGGFLFLLPLMQFGIRNLPARRKKLCEIVHTIMHRKNELQKQLLFLHSVTWNKEYIGIIIPSGNTPGQRIHWMNQIPPGMTNSWTRNLPEELNSNAGPFQMLNCSTVRRSKKSSGIVPVRVLLYT